MYKSVSVEGFNRSVREAKGYTQASTLTSSPSSLRFQQVGKERGFLFYSVLLYSTAVAFRLIENSPVRLLGLYHKDFELIVNSFLDNFVLGIGY